MCSFTIIPHLTEAQISRILSFTTGQGPWEKKMHFLHPYNLSL